MDWLLPLIGGLGIGSLLKGVVDHFLAGRAKSSDRAYQEKREVYIGLLQALREAAVKPSNENAKAFALWHARCAIFGANEVTVAAQRLIDTDHKGTKGGARDNAYQDLINAMRKDMGA